MNVTRLGVRSFDGASAYRSRETTRNVSEPHPSTRQRGQRDPAPKRTRFRLHDSDTSFRKTSQCERVWVPESICPRPSRGGEVGLLRRGTDVVLGGPLGGTGPWEQSCFPRKRDPDLLGRGDPNVSLSKGETDIRIPEL